MTNGFKEAGAKAAAMFIHFSGILENDVVDSAGRFAGKVWDVSLKGGEVYPKVGDLIISKGFFRRLYASIPWTDVLDIGDVVRLKIGADKIKFGLSIKDYELLIKRDILDQQVVDTYNHKVRRVNDIHLLKVDHEFIIAHVDIGLRSLVRRLGWEKVVDFIVRIINKKSRYLNTEELVSWKNIQPVSINPASMTMKLSVPEKELFAIPAADLGDIIFDLTAKQRIALFRTLDINTKADVFENLDFDEQKTIMKELDKKEAAQIVTHMSPDEAADLLERLPSNTVTNLLTLIESNRAKKLSALLGYSSDSAGGFMTTEFVSMLEGMSVMEAIEYIRTQTRNLDTVPYIYIVDEKNHLKGVTTLRRLLFAAGNDTVIKTVFHKTLYVYLNNSVKEVAYLMDKYKISAVPVVDENKIIHGIITMDDILSQVISIAWRKRPRISPKRL
jgi:CBS domain-containing protein/sporulation protein YlmC with PRC-barrel domain